MVRYPLWWSLTKRQCCRDSVPSFFTFIYSLNFKMIDYFISHIFNGHIWNEMWGWTVTPCFMTTYRWNCQWSGLMIKNFLSTYTFVFSSKWRRRTTSISLSQDWRRNYPSEFTTTREICSLMLREAGNWKGKILCRWGTPYWGFLLKHLSWPPLTQSEAFSWGIYV